MHCTGAGLIVSHGSDIASSGKWRQNQIAHGVKHCQAARHVGSDGVFNICDIFCVCCLFKHKRNINRKRTHKYGDNVGLIDLDVQEVQAVKIYRLESCQLWSVQLEIRDMADALYIMYMMCFGYRNG